MRKYKIWDKSMCILKGRRRTGNDTHLWMIDLTEENGISGNEEVTVTKESCATAYQTRINLETDRDRVAFAHATLGST